MKIAVAAAVMLLALSGCAELSALDKAQIHNASATAKTLRSFSMCNFYGDDTHLSYDAAWAGELGALERLDRKVNGPEVATSTALLEVPSPE